MFRKTTNNHVLNSGTKPASSEDLKRQTKLATEALQREVKKNLASPQIEYRIRSGATHFHIDRRGTRLYFVQLPAKHRGKKYEPLIGYTQLPIHSR